MSSVERKARDNRNKKRPTIGMTLIETHPDQLMWLGAADYARAQGVNLICFVGDLQAKPGAATSAPNVAFDLASADILDALIVWGSSGAGMLGLLDEAETRAFLDRYNGLPIVNVEKPLQGIPCIFTDNYEAMRRMIDHVIEVHGRQRIALIRGPASHFENQERARAWPDALKAHGFVADERMVSPPCGWLEADGAAAMRLLLDERHLRPGIDFDALIATEAQYAVGALAVLHERGVSVPDQVSVVAFNDIARAETVMPAVTTVQKQFYESGRKALQVALALLRGESVQELQDVPAELIIRRSCGCWPNEISMAGFSGETSAGGDASVAREQVVSALTHTLESIAPGASADALAQSAEQLVSAFWAGLASADAFLSALENTMRQVKLEHRQASRWHWVLSALRGCLRPLLDVDQFALAETLWQQARTLIGYEVRKAEIEFWLERAHQSGLMRAFELRMSLVESIEVLVQIIAQELPGLGIRSGYLALYDDPEQPLNEARLVLAYRAIARDVEQIALPAGGRRYPSRQLLPPDVLPVDRAYQLAVLPLYTQGRQLGFAVLEIGPTDGSLYTLMQQELSTAVQSALSAEQRRQVEVVLAQERALLRTLIDNIPDYVYIKDRQSRFVVNNAAHIRVLGAQSQEELVGKIDFDIFPSEFATQYYDSEQALMARDKPMLEHEEEVIDQSTGEHQWVSSTKVPLHDASGVVTGFVGITRDITTLKQAEEELARYASEMERRATQIQTASEVAREATSERELYPLLNRAAALIAERFGLSHTLIFMLDDPEEYAVLAAASGEMGSEMLSRGLRIRVGQEGLIGRVAATGQFRIIPDVRQSAQSLASILPGTRAEAVLPLQVGGRVIGALDVQSDQVGGIDDEGVAALSIVADQLAVAIENVRLLAQMRQTVRDLQTSSAQYTREAWQRLARGPQQLGYRYRRMGVEQAEEQTAEARRALELGTPVVTAAEGDQPGEASTVAVPVRLRDQVVGVLNLRFAGHAVSPDVLSTIEEVANRLALSMESARLLRDTQLRAVRDRVLSEASARIGESLEIHTVLKRAVQEMRSALGLKEVEIRMGAAPNQGNGKSEVE
ncbi:MAG: substrate-binding domain-containing protein [Anaerolineae bacterium]|nr:substrate-binding domain-containing protein [Anaerolineae bacterium]